MKITRVAALVALLAGCGGGSGAKPSAEFTAPAGGAVGEPLGFAATLQAGAHYHWDFGDGARGGTGSLAHVFSAAGQYTITLTVSAPGGKASASHDVAITAPSPGPTIPVVGVVRDTAGTPLEGVALSDGATALATSGADGRALFMLSGDRHTLQLAKDGYASQFQSLDLSVALAGYFEATLIAREPAMPFDADKGGSLTGKDGAAVTIAGGALVDSSGEKVTGMVTLALTPVDVTQSRTLGAFPGRFEGVAPDATTSTIVSYGTSEYALYRGSERLQLAPGSTATIEVPCYATANLDGSPLAAGDSFPLWSLDEKSGAWMKEGDGAIVASANSPTKLAMRAEVSHFSWWNTDHSEDFARRKTKCTCMHDAEICAMFGSAVYTCHLGAGPDWGDPAAATLPQPGFQFSRDIVGETTVVGFPLNMPLVIGGSAMAGAFRGQLANKFTAQDGDDVTIQLEPATTLQLDSDENITLPYNQTIVETRGFTKRRFHFTATAGVALGAEIQPEIGASGGLRLLDPSGNMVANALGDSNFGSFSYTPMESGDFVFETVMFTTGSAQLTFRNSVLVDETLDAPFDKTIDGLAGDLFRYHFPSEAGAEYDIQWMPSSTASGGKLELLDPAQASLYSNGQLGQSLDHDFTATVAGTYTVVIQDAGAVAGLLRVIKVQAGPSSDLAVADDAGSDAGGSNPVVPILLPFNQTISNVATTLSYSFTAAAGTAVIMRVTSGTADAGVVRIYATGHTLVSSFAMTHDSPISPIYHPVLLEAGGDYLIEIDPPTQGTHAFLVDLQAVTDVVPLAQRVTVHDTITGTTGTRGYTFSANAGDGIRMDQSRVCSQFNGSVVYQDLTFAENDELAVAAQSGTQLIVMRKKGGANCSGMADYDLTMRVAVPIMPGTPSAPFTFSQTNFVATQQSFSFTAPAGTILCGKVQGTGFDYFPTVLFGEGFTSNSFVSDFGLWVLTAGGTHVIDVQCDSDSGGPRNSPSTVLYLYQVAAPSPVSDPNVGQHTSLSPGQRKWFSFSSSDPWALPPSPSPSPTSFTLSYSSDDGVSKGKAILYKDNGMPFYQALLINNTTGAVLGTVSGTSSANSITAATTYYVQLAPDPTLGGPSTAIAVTWQITPSP